MRLFGFLFLFSTAVFAAHFESKKSEGYIAGNSYSGDFKYAKKNQTLYYFISENKFIINNSFDVSISPEFFYFDRFLFVPKEISLNYFGSALSAQAGYFQMRKDGPDVFSSLDYQQPKNYLDPLHSGELPLLGLRLEAPVSSYLTLEGAYIPKNMLPIIPDKNSPWYPRENKFPTRSDDFEAILPDEVRYETNNKAKTEDDLKNNYIVKAKITTAHADYVLQYAETLSQTPDITIPTLTGTLISASPVFVIALDNPINIDVTWKKVKNYGGGVTVPIDSVKMLIKLFANHQVSAEEKTNMGTLALEKTFDSLTVVIEYTNQKTETRGVDRNLATFQNLYEDAVALGLRYAPTDSFSLLFGGIYDNNMGSYLVTLRPKYYFTQKFYTELQLVALGGQEDSLLWNFEKNDSASLKLGVTF